ncbi:hypothetical protein AC249_AIPGENE12800 [Exaiptasia diaphana]|nr:hypothetical protein AC249_AIPGENE12800 [Exaiptasia diaphana]
MKILNSLKLRSWTPFSGFWAAWGTWSSHCSLPRKRKRVCANPLTQAQAPLSECGKEDGSEEQISPPKDCVSHESLGMKDERIIPNGNFGASTYANLPCLPHFARLDSKGWCAGRRQTGESVWVDLNAVKTITKISMRGRDGNDQRPTQFTLAFRKTSLDQ